MIIGIHQPNFFPWIGYFIKITRSDKFIFLDDVQFPKKGGSYVNRSEIIVNGERKWLTVEIKRNHGTWKINESKFAKSNFRKKIWGTIQANYGNAPYFHQNKALIQELVFFDAINLASYNINAITKICTALQIDTEFVRSSSLEIETLTTSTKRLVDLVRCLNGDTYISGVGGDNYQEKELFQAADIALIYNTFQYPEYEHYKYKKFYKGLSIIDLIFNVGITELRKIIKSYA